MKNLFSYTFHYSLSICSLLGMQYLRVNLSTTHLCTQSENPMIDTIQLLSAPSIAKPRISSRSADVLS